ncbi:uncharacterized protein DNG_05100 [Cephalotrichum gorgonifer]|uniref:Uncharacterized protein n=1 Tax=Cephalotrichum gorgonifer TaxID=2041049 RepID=A0AAE8N096_9PEZI|nr:uncharacterized protein DNG_05100 [Cephalotrichum gorgonifer]
MASDGRPLLIPQNRRLRHLRGIYLRNLTFERHALRTVDDSELKASSSPSASPKKSKRRRRGSSLGELGDTRSSESLRAGARRGSVAIGGAQGPAERQKRLERTVEERVADGFFSLHCDGAEPVYLSEVVERASNFNFRFFDLTRDHPDITRTSQFTVKFWAKRQNTWCLLLEDAVDLRSLHYLGSLEDRHFPPNALPPLPRDPGSPRPRPSRPPPTTPS